MTDHATRAREMFTIKEDVEGESFSVWMIDRPGEICLCPRIQSKALAERLVNEMVAVITDALDLAAQEAKRKLSEAQLETSAWRKHAHSMEREREAMTTPDRPAGETSKS